MLQLPLTVDGPSLFVRAIDLLSLLGVLSPPSEGLLEQITRWWTNAEPVRRGEKKAQKNQVADDAYHVFQGGKGHEAKWDYIKFTAKAHLPLNRL